MRKLISLLLLVIIFTQAQATHIAGGELFYRYIGPGTAANTARYEVTMRLLRECSSVGAPLNGERVSVGIYNGVTLGLVDSVVLAQTFSGAAPRIQNTPGANLCLSTSIIVCYEVGIYVNTIDLPISAAGYILSWSRYSRMNLINGVNPLGAIYVTRIPGTSAIGMGVNSSPKFIDEDTAVVCFSSRFSINFGAIDPDGDSLSYEFCEAFTGGSNGNPNPWVVQIPNLQLTPVTYAAGFNGASPLGNQVTVNGRTGVISGRSPAIVGPYVLCVCVTEWRNRVAINQHRKDFIVRVEACNLPSAELQQPGYLNCNSFSQFFENLSMSPNITNYKWSFGEPFRGNADSSNLPTPTHTYLDTGTYVVRLQIRNNTGCVAEDSSVLRVFPGLDANFTNVGNCFINPYNFTSTATTIYGNINSYTWDFGETSINTDTSTFRNPSFTYPTPGNKTVQFIVTNTKGCADTARKLINVLDKPILSLPFRDTLICSIDTLPLRSTTVTGAITWTPNINITNTTINNPLVFPKDTITYKITVNENGCVNTDSITVNVLDFITVDAGPDTSICLTDTISLRPISYALSYVWTPNIYLDNNLIKFPKSSPRDPSIKYYVTANLGKCQDRDSVTILTSPYPQVNASANVGICFGARTNLSATIMGDRFFWTPTNSLINANTLNPIAGPTRTTNYVITATNITGCLKPVSDTITVSVVPLFNVNAGRDTFVVINQPLQFNAFVQDTTRKRFTWSPSTGLDNANIYNPIGTYNGSLDSITYLVTVTTLENCISTDNIKVRILKNDPDLYVPSAFTPNLDGRNDVFRPVCIGITTLDYFSVYNRWGQLLFTTNQIGKGWDGTLAGVNQPAGTYVFMAKGTDFLGKSISKQGTVVLIR